MSLIYIKITEYVIWLFVDFSGKEMEVIEYANL